MLPAVGQGALGIEVRESDTAAQRAVALLDHAATHAAVTAERSLLHALRGGCLAPIGAWGRINADNFLKLSAVVLSPDGRERIAFESASDPADAAALGRRVANELRAQGADRLIQSARA
jgi:hydroxymethylbilane synthase